MCFLVSPYVPALIFSSLTLQRLLSTGRSVLGNKFKAGHTAMADFLLMQHESLYTPLFVVKRDFSDSFLEHRYLQGSLLLFQLTIRNISLMDPLLPHTCLVS